MSSEEKTENKTSQLPLSIKLVGLYYIAIVPISILVFTYLFSGLANAFDFMATSAEKGQRTFTLYLEGGLISLVPLFVGIGILRRNKIAWYAAVVLGVFLSIIGIVSILIPDFWFGLVAVVLSLVILWKLWEHKKVFGIWMITI